MFQPSTKDKKAAQDHIDNAASDLKNVKNELKSAKDSALSAAKSELRDASDRAEDKVRDLRATAREAGEKVQHFLHDRRDDISHAKDSAERTIRANPLASAAAAFVGGVIISRLLKR